MWLQNIWLIVKRFKESNVKKILPFLLVESKFYLKWGKENKN